ncbi:MAG: DUF1015 family protein [Actinomycetota bacterium]
MSAPLLRTLRALVVRPEAADRVVSGPYDAYSSSERLAIRAAEPLSYLHVTRTPEDLQPGETIEDLATAAATAMGRLVNTGAYRFVDEQSVFLYELTFRGHAQTGVVALVPVDAFTDGRIRKHEDVRPDRARLLANHLRHTGGTSSPIALSFRTTDEISAGLTTLTDRPPLLDHRADGIGGRVGQRVWAVPEAEAAGLIAALGDKRLYLTDGHHRAAAALLARRLGADAADDDPHGELDWAMVVIFPDDDLRVSAFNRIVVDRADRSVDELLTALTDSGMNPIEVVSGTDAVPAEPGRIAFYLGGRWFTATLGPAAGDRALDRLDVQRLQTQVLAPVFGVAEPGADPNLSYVPGTVDLAEFTARCDRTPGGVGVLLYRTGIDELFAVADDGDLMPPKSSYFAPKPLSGVFIRSLARGSLARFGPSGG